MKTLLSVRRMVMSLMAIVGVIFFIGIMIIVAMISRGMSDGFISNSVFYYVFFAIGGIEFLLSLLLERVDKAIVMVAKALRNRDCHIMEVEEELQDLLKKEKFRKIMQAATLE